MTRLLAAALALLLPLPVMAQDQKIIVSHGISPFGELKYPADFKHFDYVNPDAPKGGRMSFRGTAASATFDSLNAFILAGEPAQGLGRLYNSLLVAAQDEAGGLYGQIAESLEYPEDRAWVIFHMRPEARFSDGKPITAEDVVFSINILREKGHPYYGITLAGVATVEALDTHRVKFTFKEGVATRDLPGEVGTISILPKHYYETVDFTRSTLEPPVGSGRYVIDRVSAGRTITYCVNPDYWGKNLPVNVGSHNFDCVVYEYFSDNTAAFEAFKAGTFLFHEEFTSLIWATGYEFPALSRNWVVRTEIPDQRPAGTQGFWINLRRDKFADPRVREALGMLFNYEWSNATLFYGLYGRTDSFWENSTMEASGLPEGAELAVLERYRDQLPAEIFTQPAFVPPVSSTTQQTDRQMMRQASALLDAAGWEVGRDGKRRNARGELLVVEIIDDSPSLQRIVMPFVQNMQAAGIEASFNLVDAAQMQQRQEDFDYDMTIARLAMNMSPSVELRTIFGSQGAQAKGTLNLSGVNDPVVDALIEEIVGAKSREDLETHVRALDRILRAKHIWVPNWTKSAYWVAHWDVFGRPDVQPPLARGDEHWWWDQRKHDALRAQGALR